MGLCTKSALVLLLALFLQYLPSLLRTPLPPHVTGFVAEGWEGVEEVFRRRIERGHEKGATFSVYHKGVLVVDLAGGYADDDIQWAMGTDIIFGLSSTVKATQALCVALQVDRGFLSYDKPVAHYWPEFAQHGKAEITVEQLLSHQVGITTLEEDSCVINDKPEDITATLARQRPNWPPGTGHGYHGYTIGPLMHTLVKLTDPKHRDMDQFFKEEIADKLGLDIYHGLPDSVAARTARFYWAPLFPDLLAASRYWELYWTMITGGGTTLPERSLHFTGKVVGDVLNHPDLRRRPFFGFATARSLAHLMGIVANGKDQTGKTLLSPEVTRRLGRPLATGKDKILLMNITYGLGATLRETPSGGWMVGAPGAGGQMAYFDADAKLGWAYLRNHHSVYMIGDDPNYLEMEKAMYETVRRLEKKA